MKKDNTTLLTVVLAIAALIVVIISLIPKNSVKEIEKGKILEDYNEFYTVNSCVYRVITYISSSDKESLLLILDNDYKSKNKINEDNVLSVLPEVTGQSTFISKKMYYQKLNENVTKYYVYGQIEEESFSGVGDATDAYFIVYLDSLNKTFSIEPYSEENFKNDEESFIGGDTDE